MKLAPGPTHSHGTPISWLAILKGTPSMQPIGKQGMLWDDPRWKHQGPNYTQKLWEDRNREARAKTQDELKWGASGCWIALYIYYSTRGLCKAIHEATYWAMLCQWCHSGAKAMCQDRFSSTILLGGPGMQETNEEVSPDTSRCWLVRTIKSGSYGWSPGTREALGVSPGFCGVSPDRGKVVRSWSQLVRTKDIPEVG